MKSKATNVLRVLLGLVFVLALMAINVSAQQSSIAKNSNDDKSVESNGSGSKNSTDSSKSSKTTKPSKISNSSTAPAASPNPVVGESAGDYTVISSIELGYRGLSVSGNTNKYQSDLNYRAGPRLFDTSFLMKAKEGRDTLFDTVLVNSTGWGADPYGNMRIDVEKPEWYRFTGTYRRFRYYNFLNNLANPNWIFTTGSGASFRQNLIAPNPQVGVRGYNVRQQIGDFDLTILPNNDRIRFNVGFSPERYSGPGYSNYHFNGNEFVYLSQLQSSANDFRLGADWKLGPVDFSLLQGFRRFKDNTFIDNNSLNPGINPGFPQAGSLAASPSASLTSFNRVLGVGGNVNYTRFSVHTFLAKKLDLTARLIYSSSTSNGNLGEEFAGLNLNPRTTGFPAAPNVVNFGAQYFGINVKRPQTLADFGVTYLATRKLRISNTFRFEQFQINGGDLSTAVFNVTKGTTVTPITYNNNGFGFGSYLVTHYKKYQDTVEGDYQFNDRYSFFFGYRYGTRRIGELRRNAYNLNSPLPGLIDATQPATAILEEEEENHTNSVFGGFRMRPRNNWTIYFDGERGTADNVFTRVGNYDYTNLRARTRYVPNRRLALNFSFVLRNNSNPGEIDQISLEDFGVEVKSRTFNASINWTPKARVSFSGGYDYNWVNSDAVIDYTYGIPPATIPGNGTFRGHSLYFMRNNFFYLDTTVQINPRVMLYAAYRINQDNGQGSRVSNPTAAPGVFVNSYPMSFQSPEARLVIKLNRRLDWNLGYQYFNYRESLLASPYPQNYHAHMPYVSLRLYFGRPE